MRGKWERGREIQTIHKENFILLQSNRMKERTKLRSGMSREEIERYLDEQDELELEELRMKKQKKYDKEYRDKREECLNSVWLESYDVRRDEQMEKDLD